METKTLTSSAIWYHISSAMGDSSSRWTKGAARKGMYNAQNNLSLILFDAEEIREAIGSDLLLEADLVISRDSTYGTEPVTVSIAPAYITSMEETYMSRSECIRMAKRNMHKFHTTEGETATFHIPGATLREMWLHEVNAFLLYQEKDGSDSYCKFVDSAQLKLKVGYDVLATPVWTRVISAGDTICSEIYSHLADLREIEYYIALRNQYHHYSGTIIWARSMQDYGGWTLYINMLRTLAENFLEDEQRTYDWTPLPDGKTAWDSPNAEVINNLRNVFISSQAARYESNGFTAFQSSAVANSDFNENAVMNWSQQNTLVAGVTKMAPTSAHQPTIYLKHISGWIFDWGSTVIEKAALELTIRGYTKAKVHIQLIGITASTTPTSARYRDVFNGTVIGESDCTTNSTNTIQINSVGIEQLANGTIHGMGIRYDGNKIELSKTATLILNENDNQ